jgi:hypothetical protein
VRLLTVDGYWRRLDDGFESDLKVSTPQRWFRVGLFYGEAPGSHMIGKHLTAWRTRVDDLRGVNVRFGWWPRPCVTVLLHTRPVCAEVPRGGADAMDRVIEGLRSRP